MVTTEEPSNPSQPLLEETRPESSESDPNQYLQITYNHGPRPFKDLTFLVLFLIFVFSTFGFGIFSIFHRNPNYSNVSEFKFSSNSSSCVKSSVGFSDSGSFDEVLSNELYAYYRGLNLGKYDFAVEDLIWTLVVTLIISVPLGLVLLLTLKHYTKQIVYVSLPFFVVVPIFFNVYWFVACTVNSSCSDNFPLVYRIVVLVVVFLIIGVIVWIFVVNWHRIELTITIVGVGSDALWRNLGLFCVLPWLTLGLFVYFAPIVVFLVFARLNGKIAPRVSDGEYYCAWKRDSWVPAYYTLAILTVLWSLTAMLEAQVYVISGTIAQWYFSKDDESIPRRTIRSSLRNAFGPSSGTVCFSGLLIFIVRVVRAAVDSARQEDTSGIISIMLRCCVNALLSAIDFLNKFTINFAAITGEAYCSSARMTYELLKRNLLSAVFVETVSSRVLVGIIFVLSAIYAIAVCAILKAVSNLGPDSYIVAGMAWVLLLVVLGFFIRVLDNVIETVYVCYAIDRDRGEVSKREVHQVYVQLPISRNHSSSLPARTLDV